MVQLVTQPRGVRALTDHLLIQVEQGDALAISGDCAANGVSGPTRRAEVRRDGHCE